MSLSLDLSGDAMLTGTLVAQNGNAAEHVQKLILSGRDMLAELYHQNGAAALAQAGPGIRSALDGFIMQSLQGFTAKVSHAAVSLSLPSPKNWPSLVRATVALVAGPANPAK
jgi:hypothetical protein